MLLQLEQQQVLLQQLQDLQVDRCKRLQVLLQLLDRPLPLRLLVPLQLASSFLQRELQLLLVLLELLQVLLRR